MDCTINGRSSTISRRRILTMRCPIVSPERRRARLSVYGKSTTYDLFVSHDFSWGVIECKSLFSAGDLDGRGQASSVHLLVVASANLWIMLYYQHVTGPLYSNRQGFNYSTRFPTSNQHTRVRVPVLRSGARPRDQRGPTAGYEQSPLCCRRCVADRHLKPKVFLQGTTVGSLQRTDCLS